MKKFDHLLYKTKNLAKMILGERKVKRKSQDCGGFGLPTAALVRPLET